MNEEEFYKIIKNRNVEVFVNNLELALQNPKSTGATIHSLLSLRQYFESVKNLYNDSFFQEERFSELREQKVEFYEEISHKILVAVNELGIKI